MHLMIFFWRLYDIIDQNARDGYFSRVQSAFLSNVFHLRDNDASGIFRGCRQVHGFEQDAFFFYGKIACFVCGCAADQGCLQGRSLVIQVFFAADVYDFHKVFACQSVHFAALHPWICECVKPDMG